MTRTENMDDPVIKTTIADEGDVILVIGEGKDGVRVSSHVLSCASKVFKAMFSRKFKEGSELASRQVCRASFHDNLTSSLE